MQIGGFDSEAVVTKGKRDNGPGISIGVDAAWRTPKRQRKTWSRAEGRDAKENAAVELPNSMFLYLRDSLKDVCSFDDLNQRMRVYLNLGSCKEIFEVMNQVTKVCFGRPQTWLEILVTKKFLFQLSSFNSC